MSENVVEVCRYNLQRGEDCGYLTRNPVINGPIPIKIDCSYITQEGKCGYNTKVEVGLKFDENGLGKILNKSYEKFKINQGRFGGGRN